MSTHAAPQFTPAQLIDAGRRAETQGRPDLAVQFYRYLAEHFAEAPETAEAHNALGRIGAAQALPLIARAPATRMPRMLRNSMTAHRDRYRSSRGLAVVVGALGWVWAAGSAAAVPVYVALRAEEAAWSGAEMLPMAGGAGGGLVLGLGVVLVARIARAVLDQANDLHHLVALERARLGLD